MSVVFEGMLFADYHQFYLADALADSEEATWSDLEFRQGISAGVTMVSISTARNMHVPVRVELHGARPSPELTEADHVVEASFHTTGEIIIAGCTDYQPDAARFAVPPGPLRVLVVCHGLGSLSEDGLEGDDRYALHLWPAAEAPVAVIRQWEAG